MKIIKLAYTLMTLILLTTIGCAKTTEGLSFPNEIEPNIEDNDAYPIYINTPISVNESYPPGEKVNTQTAIMTQISPPLIIPEPDPNNGIVVGTLISKTMHEPMPFITIYMANKVPLEPGPGYVISLQQKSSPQTVTNERGEFIVVTIPPDEYIPLMVTPFGTFSLLDLDSKEVELEITKGVVIDLGETYVNWP